MDGIAVAAVTAELAAALTGGRIEKIRQPRPDEIVLAVHKEKNHPKALLSANAGSPRACLTQSQKESPLAAPLFLMVLRKHLGGGKVVAVRQMGLERILCLDIESMNEMGDKTVKTLILEMMGKHSNLILTDDKGTILDSIKRVGPDKSSVRLVLPGLPYALPPDQGKLSPLELDAESFAGRLAQAPAVKLSKALYTSYTGISPVMAAELCFRAGLSPDAPCESLSDPRPLFQVFAAAMERVKAADFAPELYADARTHRPFEFSMLPLGQYVGCAVTSFPSPSALLEAFYSERDNTYHIQQKAHDLRRLVQNNVERCVKKKELQQKSRQDAAPMDTWRRYGELLTANLHALKPGMTTVSLPDFYREDMAETKISLDPQKTPAENAQRYFAKYNKAKRTLAALEVQEAQNDADLAYLEGVLVAIQAASDPADLAEIRRELAEQGFLRKKAEKRGKDGKPKASRPLHFKSPGGCDIFVGKSNTQNDWLTLKFAEPQDLWFHTKNIPGSHVILKTPDGNASDADRLAAANLAAFYSKARQGSQVPVDYTQRKNVKKPRGAKPGLVIYEQNKTAYITPDEGLLNQLEKLE